MIGDDNASGAISLMDGLLHRRPRLLQQIGQRSGSFVGIRHTVGDVDLARIDR